MPDYDKAKKLVAKVQEEVTAGVTSSDPDRYLIDVCRVLQKQDNPALRELATNMLKQLGQPTLGHGELCSCIVQYGPIHSKEQLHAFQVHIHNDKRLLLAK